MFRAPRTPPPIFAVRPIESSPLAGRGVCQVDSFSPPTSVDNLERSGFVYYQVPEAQRLAIVDEHHKVTDFAVVKLWCDHKEVKVYGYFVPVLVEVKLARPPVPMTANYRPRPLLLAATQVKDQVKFLFSTCKQPAVIAIAAAGPWWRWSGILSDRVLDLKPPSKRDDGDTIESRVFKARRPKGVPMKDRKSTDWSPMYEIGTNASNQMLKVLTEWVQDVFATPESLLEELPEWPQQVRV